MISLRWKLALAMVVMSSFATIAFGLASYRSTEQRLIAEIDRSLAEIQRGVVERALGGGVFRSDGLDTVSVLIVGPNGAVLQSTFPAGVTSHPTSARTATVATSEGDYRVRATQFSGGGVAMVGRPLDETYRVLEGVRNRTILLIGLVAAAGALIGVWLADVFTAPLRRLTAAADEVAESGRPAAGVARVPDGSAARRDEVSRLSAGFGRMLRALARSQEEQERLVQDAGHELRTPLTSLRTNLDTLRRYPDIPPEQRAAIIDDLHAEAQELSELVDEIVAVAGGGLTADGAGEAYDGFDLHAAASALAVRYSRRAGREVRVHGEPLAVVAQRTGVQRAISCLLDNARKFDTTGGPIDVTVASDPDGRARVTVADRGPGIPTDELDLVFDRFHRAAEARTLPGSGLGLSIVKAVAERHGGGVHAAPREGGGAEVGFTIPVEPPVGP